MPTFQLHTVYSPWYGLLCLALGVGMAWLLYRKDQGPWPLGVKWVLATLRALLITLVAFLLLEPYTRIIKQEELKPTVVLALDNSQSVQLFTPAAALSQTLQGLEGLAEKLRNKGLRVEVQTMAGSDSSGLVPLSKSAFRAPVTNLHALLHGVDETYGGQNLVATVLVSDGVHNLGPTPTYQSYRSRIYPLALGDTIPRKDVVLADLEYNKINYSGTSFPLKVTLRHQGYAGPGATVLLQENGKTLLTKRVTLPRSGFVSTTFQLTSAQLGKKHYEVVVQPLAQEFTQVNNRRHAYLEVVKGKLNILLAATAPHPDIKALRAALATNPLLQVEVVVGPFQSPRFSAPYDAAILHQFPSMSGVGQAWLQKIRSAKVPVFYVVGAQTNIPAFNALQTGVQFAGSGTQYDQVQPILNPRFQRFSTEPLAQTRIPAWPPAPVPFGEWRLSPGTEVILYQQIGAVRSTKPLLVYRSSAVTPSAVLLTDGSWQWRLTEAADHGTAQIYDGLMAHVVQLLANKRDQKRLHVYPVKDVVGVAEEPVIQADAYNAVQEEIFGQTVSLSLTREDGQKTQHQFENVQAGEGLRLGSLAPGVYRFAASAKVENTMYRDSGEFIVEQQQLETITSLANHTLLDQLSQRSQTRLYYPGQLQALEQDLLQANFKTILRSKEEEKDLMEQYWFYYLLLGLALSEWALRRFYGKL
ncbi:VWA domain-containing protein [Nibribacter ruber]|uniref:VWA domain-containing protein n=1 Tax=Nibribacter ruber TaxID=2698458 RepID=A0A6P1P444_9BACT|nr:VWA domain-containing protein [Nibribacter ruber]QHL89135.1 VWA domain-containing protein [Nibribacter ruber]